MSRRPKKVILKRKSQIIYPKYKTTWWPPRLLRNKFPHLPDVRNVLILVKGRIPYSIRIPDYAACYSVCHSVQDKPGSRNRRAGD